MIYGPKHVNREWRIKYNEELHKLFKEPNILRSVKINTKVARTFQKDA
jgi:hypothetical protein